jgi:ribonuclease Y
MKFWEFITQNSGNPWFWLLAVAGVAIIAGLLGTLIRKFVAERSIRIAEQRTDRILSDASKDAKAIVKEAELKSKEELLKIRSEFEEEVHERRRELNSLERSLGKKGENLDKKVDVLAKKETEMVAREREVGLREKVVKRKSQDLAEILEEERRKLETISRMSIEEAKQMLCSRLEEEVKRECALRLKRYEDDLRQTCDKRAHWLLTEAIQRCAADHVADTTVSVVHLPNDEMKGRIIGREGRNIRAFENATGVDIIVDDTPEAVILSGYDPIRREIARISLERLVIDGRIHPARIEEVVNKVTEEMDVTLREAGEQAGLDADIHSLPAEAIRLLGRLKYRTSYGQNVLQHSVETAQMAGVIAAELGINVREAKRAAFLHDIGKAVDHEVEGSHADIGSDLARKFGEPDAICHAIAAHHGEVTPNSVIAVLTQAVDAVSAGRPGARRETLETYIKRLETLEAVANAFEGVDKSYAIQAGRELRIIVEPDKLDDVEAHQLARDVSSKVESELEYPGQIKVTVIRETRAIEYAK